MNLLENEYYVVYRKKHMGELYFIKTMGYRRSIRVKMMNKGYIITEIFSNKKIETFMGKSFREIRVSRNYGIETYNKLKDWIEDGCKCEFKRLSEIEVYVKPINLRRKATFY